MNYLAHHQPLWALGVKHRHKKACLPSLRRQAARPNRVALGLVGRLRSTPETPELGRFLGSPATRGTFRLGSPKRVRHLALTGQASRPVRLKNVSSGFALGLIGKCVVVRSARGNFPVTGRTSRRKPSSPTKRGCKG